MMQCRRGRRGFSFIELMISMTVLSAILAVSMLIMKRVKEKELISKLEVSQMIEAQSLLAQVTKDIGLAVRLTGQTTAGGIWPNEIFGILPDPFDDPVATDRISDGLSLYIANSSLSTQANFEVINISGSSSPYAFTISGDFQPLFVRATDYFVLTNGETTELFRVDSPFTYAGGNTQFTTNLDVPSSIISGGDFPQWRVFRASHVTYRVGSADGTSSKGLFRSVDGVETQLSKNVASMQIFYNLVSQDITAQSDCSTKDNSRWFAHATAVSECDWNDVASVQVQIVLESAEEMNATMSVNPHDLSVSDGRVRTVLSASKASELYTQSIN